MSKVWILAQNEAPSSVMAEPLSAENNTETTITVSSDPNAAGGNQARKPPMGTSYWIFLALMFVMMYFILFRGPRKKQQQHKQMVQTLAKNDKVRTIGGIIGTVVDVKDDEITLKVDESNNTKIKVIPSAIGRNISQEKS
ncbi:MAG: preprotein translocase subunit YajC [Sedimentisphaerales bacterium]|nr:preprotein translocase subunit YajC [Sedimentisphaerales bacterium]